MTRAAACLGALVALAAILAFAGAQQDEVRLLYDESGNGCRELVAAADRELSRALLPARILVFTWVLLTGLALTWSTATAPEARRAGELGALVLAGAQMLFFATDVLSAALPLLLLWAVGLGAAIALAVAATRRRRRPVAAWLWLCAGWLVVAAGMLPVALLALTGDGAIRSC